MIQYLHFVSKERYQRIISIMCIVRSRDATMDYMQTERIKKLANIHLDDFFPPPWNCKEICYFFEYFQRRIIPYFKILTVNSKQVFFSNKQTKLFWSQPSLKKFFLEGRNKYLLTSADMLFILHIFSHLLATGKSVKEPIFHTPQKTNKHRKNALGSRRLSNLTEVTQ